MSGDGQLLAVESVPIREIVEALRETHPFARPAPRVCWRPLAGVESVERVSAQEGAVLVEPLQPWSFYWLLLKGETRAERPEKTER